MEDHPLGCTDGSQRGKHIVVGIPIVDDQRLIQTLRQFDVPAERLDLNRAQLWTSAVVVQSGFPDGTHGWIGCEHLDGRPRILECAFTMAVEGARGIIRVQRNRSRDLRVGAGEGGGELRGLHIATDLHHTRHADGCGLGEELFGIRGAITV